MRSRTPPELELVGGRALLRPLRADDWEGWRDVRRRSRAWLEAWEPRPEPGATQVGAARRAVEKGVRGEAARALAGTVGARSPRRRSTTIRRWRGGIREGPSFRVAHGAAGRTGTIG